MRTELALVIALALSGCAEVTTIDDYDCPDGGTALSYDNFGRPFLDAWCNSCHSAGSGDRQGAPDDVNFDSRGDVADWRARIFARSAADNDSMPPGPDDPPRAERDRLAEWLACGAP
jgi:uncharacterized membrane protein